MRQIACFLMVIMISMTVFGSTMETTSTLSREAEQFNFFQEADITFFQTFPFMVFWGQVVNVNLFPAEPMNFSVILTCAAVIAVANSVRHANKVVNDARASQNK